MMEVYIMKGQMDTQYGQILIDTDVIATYAGSVAVECFGIVGMAAVNMKDGLVKLLKRDCLLYTSPSPRDRSVSRMPSSA